MKVCPKCNAELEDDALFCGVCGEKLDAEETGQAEESVASEEKHCVHCGKEIEADCLYCPFCGKPQDVEDDSKEEALQEGVKEEPEQEPEPHISEQPKQHYPPSYQPSQPYPSPSQSPLSLQPNQQGAGNQPPSEKKHRSWTWFWIAMAITAIITAGGVEVYYYLRESNGLFSDEDDYEFIEETAENSSNEDDYAKENRSVEEVTERLNALLSNALTMPDNVAVRAYFSEEFKNLYIKVEEIDKNHDEPGYWNYNIWGQVGNPDNYVTQVYTPTGKNAHAEVTFMYEWETEKTNSIVPLELVFENGDWYIDDINENKRGMKSYLENKNTLPITEESERVLEQERNQRDDMVALQNEILEGFRQMNEAEDRIILAKSGKDADHSEQIRENMAFIQEKMKTNRELIEKMRQQLSESTINGDEMMKTIDRLVKQLQEKDRQVQQLRELFLDGLEE